MKKLIVILILLAAAAGTAYGVYRYRSKSEEVKVTTLPVSRGDVVQNVQATGTLEPVKTVTVGSQVSGIVKELNADYNSIVKQGQVIARLDPALFQTQIEQQEANLVRSNTDIENRKVSLEDARVKMKRAEALAAKKLNTTQDLENARVAVRQAEASLKSSEAALVQSQASLNQAKVNLDNTVITAPITGIVISRNVDVGQTVAASMSAPTLFLIAEDLTKMQARASVDESDVGLIRPNQVARFRVDAYPTETFVGSVRQVRLEAKVVQNVVTYIAVIDVPNPQLKLKPGMTATVTLEIAKRENVLRVPNTALRFRPTAEMFTALNQPIPPELTGGGRGAGARNGAQAAAGREQGGARPGAAAGGRAATGTQRGQQADQRGQAGVAQGTQRGQQADNAGGVRGGQGGGTDPEARARFQERMQSMTPEQRAQFAQRMGGGGFPGAQGGGRQGAPGQEAAPMALATTSALTIDSLFGPLQLAQGTGRVYAYTNKQMAQTRVRTGITDGTYTELLTDSLPEGAECVTDITIGEVSTTRTNAQSPFMPGRGGRGGGFGGGPGGGGGPRGMFDR